MRGTTPLHAAASHFSADYTSIVVALLHAGACVGALDSAGRTPLQVCTRYRAVPYMGLFSRRYGSEGVRHEFLNV